VDERFAAAWRLLPEYLREHVLLSATALALGLLISLPLVVACSRSARVRWPVLAFASLIQTIPSLALLALFYPVLLALSEVSERVFGRGVPALGFLPSLLALTLYSILPVLRNGATAIANLDPAVLEAARGVGMTQRQQLLRVELPLAAPYLMAGVRTSAVWVIGTATLATPVGQTSLGNYIFSGLQIENWVAVLFGCVAAVLLALVTDQLLALIEVGIKRRRYRFTAAGVGLMVAGLALTLVPALSNSKPAYVIGAKSFTEQYILSALMAERIGRNGVTVSRRTGLGSAIIFRALAAGEIDAYVDYSGTLWANALQRTDRPARAALLEELGAQLQERYGVKQLGPLGFENAYALAMRREQAQLLGIRTIADLTRHAPNLVMGGDFEFFARPEWTAVRERYGLQFARLRQFQSTFMYRAVASDEVQVISAFSSDGRIAAHDLVVLEDSLQAFLPYDAVVLLSPAKSADARLSRALLPLVRAIPIELMREASLKVDSDREKLTPVQAAAWLAREAGLE
jgi:osmoprotectant transport system permease protein